MIDSAIKVYLMGRLGNQLFQYAFGRSLADALDCNLVLDYRAVAANPDSVVLNKFSIRASYFDEKLMKEYPHWAWKISRGLRRQRRPSFGFFHEKIFTFDEQFNHHSDELLSGFWQSYKYINRSDALLRDLSLKRPFSEQQQSIADQMKTGSSVAIHIRRGDYLNNPKALAKHGICSLDYYQQAVTTIKNKVGAPQFFVFSDDASWVRANLAIENAVFVSDMGFSETIDLLLIAQCKHQIIANSSFSWWGAFLNSYPEKNRHCSRAMVRCADR